MSYSSYATQIATFAQQNPELVSQLLTTISSGVTAPKKVSTVPVKTVAAPAPSPNIIVVPTNNTPPPKKKGFRRLIFGIIVAIIVFVMIIVAFNFCSAGRSSTSCCDGTCGDGTGSCGCGSRTSGS